MLSDVKATAPETFIPEIRGRSLRLYSTLSKGVHWEFFTSVMPIDSDAVLNNIRETIELVSDLGLASHFIPTAYASLTPADALAAYLSVRRSIQ